MRGSPLFRTVRHARTTLVLTAVAALAVVLPVAPASAAAPRLHATATVQLRSPEQTRPLDLDCWRGSSPALCGVSVVTVDLSGFDAFGGIPTCDDAEGAALPAGCEEPLATLTETEGTRVDVVVRCAGSLLPRVGSFPVTTERTRLVGYPEVNPLTRRSSDTARLQVGFTFPVGETVALCRGKAARLVTAVARNITVGWSSDTGSVPAGTAKVPGLHRFR